MAKKRSSARPSPLAWEPDSPPDETSRSRAAVCLPRALREERRSRSGVRCGSNHIDTMDMTSAFPTSARRRGTGLCHQVTARPLPSSPRPPGGTAPTSPGHAFAGSQVPEVGLKLGDHGQGLQEPPPERVVPVDGRVSDGHIRASRPPPHDLRPGPLQRDRRFRGRGGVKGAADCAGGAGGGGPRSRAGSDEGDRSPSCERPPPSPRTSLACPERPGPRARPGQSAKSTANLWYTCSLAAFALGE